MGAGNFRQELIKWKVLRHALRDFDIIHFNFGQSLFWPRRTWLTPDESSTRARAQTLLALIYNRIVAMRDLGWLKRAGKGIIVTYQGSDARQDDYCRKYFAISAADEANLPAQMPAMNRWAIQRFSRVADRIYALNPDLLHVLPKGAEFVPYASVDPLCFHPVAVDNPVPRVVHAPTNRSIKGTHYLIEAVNRLQNEGVRFEFVLVENLTHADAMKVYRAADLLVDQLLVGWYGALAVELMAMGKPVICYLREEDFGFLPPDMRVELPIIQASPATIYDTLKHWLTDRRHDLPGVGAAGRAYVEHWHDPLKIAARLKADYESIMTSKGRRFPAENPTT